MNHPPIILPRALQPLAALNRWVAWKLVMTKGKDGALRPTKVPYRADALDVKAKSNDPSTWRDLKTAMLAYDQDRCDGIMFAITGSDFGAFDLDDCRDAKSGDILPWAADKIERAKTYVEITPSGEGLRIIGLVTGEHVHRVLPMPNANGAKVELYRKATRFITVTGRELGAATTLANIDPLLDQTLAELDRKPPKPAKHDLDKLIKDGCGDDFGGDRSRAVWYVIHALLEPIAQRVKAELAGAHVDGLVHHVTCDARQAIVLVLKPLLDLAYVVVSDGARRRRAGLGFGRERRCLQQHRRLLHLIEAEHALKTWFGPQCDQRVGHVAVRDPFPVHPQPLGPWRP
jgi:hypothetical protein